jgi:hypothetical protein
MRTVLNWTKPSERKQTIPLDNASLIADLAECMVDGAGIISPPIDPLALIKDEPIVAIGSNYGEAFDGRIEWRGDHFNLYYNTRHGNEKDRRVRFSISHEIGHAAIPWHVEALMQSLKSHSSSSEYVSDNKVEREADEFAASLLMPRLLFKSVSRKVPDLRTLIPASEKFQTSLLSTVVRYVHTTDFACLVFVSDGHKVNWHFRSEEFVRTGAIGLKKGIILPESSCTRRLAEGKAKAKGVEFVENLIEIEDWFEHYRYRYPDVLEQAMPAGRYGYLTLLAVEEA